MIVNVETILGDVVVMTETGDTYQVNCPNNFPGTQTVNMTASSIYRIVCGLGGTGTIVAYLINLSEITPSTVLSALLSLQVQDVPTTNQVINVVAQP